MKPLKEFLSFYRFALVFFSYNWPGPNNGAEYGDADEVEEGSPI